MLNQKGFLVVAAGPHQYKRIRTPLMHGGKRKVHFVLFPMLYLLNTFCVFHGALAHSV